MKTNVTFTNLSTEDKTVLCHSVALFWTRFLMPPAQNDAALMQTTGDPKTDALVQNMPRVPHKYSPKQIGAFMHDVFKHLHDAPYFEFLRTDYGAEGHLAAIAMKHGISRNAFPYKTHTFIAANCGRCAYAWTAGSVSHVFWCADDNEWCPSDRVGADAFEKGRQFVDAILELKYPLLTGESTAQDFG